MNPIRLFAAICLVTSTVIAASSSSAPVVPDRVVSLFNGKDISSFFTWDVKHGRDNDVDRVFTVVERIDDAPAIRISGQHFGGIVPLEQFANYRFLQKTAWGAQHDMKTLQPAPARTFEPASLSGHESAGLVRLLMESDRPSPEIIAAVQAAIAWYQDVKLTGIRIERFRTPEGWDTRVVQDPAAPALWARFYELGTNRPIFSGRDAVIKYSMAEIERERRGGYGWYSERPRSLLETDYPRWAAKWVK